jgi:hypothetical protein
MVVVLVQKYPLMSLCCFQWFPDGWRVETSLGVAGIFYMKRTASMLQHEKKSRLRIVQSLPHYGSLIQE